MISLPKFENGKLIVVCLVCGDEYVVKGEGLGEVYDELDALGWWDDGDASERCPKCTLKLVPSNDDAPKPSPTKRRSISGVLCCPICQKDFELQSYNYQWSFCLNWDDDTEPPIVVCPSCGSGLSLALGIRNAPPVPRYEIVAGALEGADFAHVAALMRKVRAARAASPDTWGRALSDLNTEGQKAAKDLRVYLGVEEDQDD